MAGHRVGFETDPGDARLGRLRRREDDVNGSVGVPRAASWLLTDPTIRVGVAPVVGAAVDGQ